MKQLEVQINVRNNLLKERRLELGFSQSEMAKRIGIPPYVYMCLENLKHPGCSERTFENHKIKIAIYFNCAMPDIFPPELDSVKNSKVVKKIDMDEVHRIYYERDNQYLLDSQENMEHWHGVDREVERALSTLSERESQVVRLSYGIGTGLPRTREELSRIFGVSKARIYQIEAKAIRKLRHPSRSRVLKQFMYSGNEFDQFHDKYLEERKKEQEERKKEQAISEQRKKEQEMLNYQLIEKYRKQEEMLEEYKKNNIRNTVHRHVVRHKKLPEKQLPKHHLPEYRSWADMIKRCEDKNHKYYKYYGGRDICVHSEWKTFENFLADMGPKPSSKYTIDRVNTDRDYWSGNCRWATEAEQTRNRANTIKVNGVSLPELAQNYALKYATVLYRYNRGDRKAKLVRPAQTFKDLKDE